MHKRLRILTGTALLGAMTATAHAGHTNLVLQTELSGTEQVDNSDPTNRLPGDPDGSGSAYVFGIDGDPTTLCYVLLVDHIQLVPVGSGMAAHIHEGARFTNGPVVAALAGPEDGNAADCLTEGEAGKFPTGEPGIVQRILNNPSDFYINVHNPEYPAGSIRGTLRYQLKEDEHDHEHDHGKPGEPMNLSAFVYSASAIEATWDRSMDDGLVLGYRVYIDGQFVREVPGNSVFVEGLASGQSYEIAVEAVDDEGNRSDRSMAILVMTQ